MLSWSNWSVWIWNHWFDGWFRWVVWVNLWYWNWNIGFEVCSVVNTWSWWNSVGLILGFCCWMEVTSKFVSWRVIVVSHKHFSSIVLLSNTNLVVLLISLDVWSLIINNVVVLHHSWTNFPGIISSKTRLENWNVAKSCIVTYQISVNEELAFHDLQSVGSCGVRFISKTKLKTSLFIKLDLTAFLLEIADIFDFATYDIWMVLLHQFCKALPISIWKVEEWEMRVNFKISSASSINDRNIINHEWITSNGPCIHISCPEHGEFILFSIDDFVLDSKLIIWTKLDGAGCILSLHLCVDSNNWVINDTLVV